MVIISFGEINNSGTSSQCWIMHYLNKNNELFKGSIEDISSQLKQDPAECARYLSNKQKKEFINVPTFLQIVKEFVLCHLGENSLPELTQEDLTRIAMNKISIALENTKREKQQYSNLINEGSLKLLFPEKILFERSTDSVRQNNKLKKVEESLSQLVNLNGEDKISLTLGDDKQYYYAELSLITLRKVFFKLDSHPVKTMDFTIHRSNIDGREICELRFKFFNLEEVNNYLETLKPSKKPNPVLAELKQKLDILIDKCKNLEESAEEEKKQIQEKISLLGNKEGKDEQKKQREQLEERAKILHTSELVQFYQLIQSKIAQNFLALQLLTTGLFVQNKPYAGQKFDFTNLAGH